MSGGIEWWEIVKWNMEKSNKYLLYFQHNNCSFYRYINIFIFFRLELSADVNKKYNLFCQMYAWKENWSFQCYEMVTGFLREENKTNTLWRDCITTIIPWAQIRNSMIQNYMAVLDFYLWFWTVFVRIKTWLVHES